MDVVYQAYVVGGEGDYDDVLARTRDGARQRCEELYDDYFGDPIVWAEPLESGTYQSGQFYAGPHDRRTIIVTQRQVDPR